MPPSFPLEERVKREEIAQARNGKREKEAQAQPPAERAYTQVRVSSLLLQLSKSRRECDRSRASIPACWLNVIGSMYWLHATFRLLHRLQIMDHRPSSSRLDQGARILRAEMGFWWDSFRRPFLRTFLIAFVLSMLGAVVLLVTDEEPFPWSAVIFLPIVNAVHAALLASVVGGVVWIWRLVGPWIIVPLVLVPLSVVAVFWLGSDLLAEQGRHLVGALSERAETYESPFWLSGPGAAHGGAAILLVLMMPLLLLDLGAVALHPSVLIELVILALEVSILLFSATVVAGFISSAVLLRAYLRGFRARHKNTESP